MNPLSMGLLGMIPGMGSDNQQQGGGNMGMSALGLQPFGFLKSLQGIMQGHPPPYSGLAMLQGFGGGMSGGMGSGMSGGHQPGSKSPYDNLNPMQMNLLHQLLQSLTPRV